MQTYASTQTVAASITYTPNPPAACSSYTPQQLQAFADALCGSQLGSLTLNPPGESCLIGQHWPTPALLNFGLSPFLFKP